MKRYIIVIFFLIIQQTLFSQNDISGDFEEWFCYPPNVVYPHGWLNTVFNTPCFDPDLTTDKESDSQTGNLAAKMMSNICSDPVGAPRLQAGFLFTSQTDDYAIPPLDWSRSYAERPNELSFYHKFQPEGTDSAAVYLLLFNYDAENYLTDTVAFASGYIHEETTEYTEFILPIEYLKEDTPSFVHILFICSKTMGDLGYFTFTPAYDINASPGTTLWIDNVVLRGGTVNTTSPQEEDWNFDTYPNPVDAEIYIDISQQIQVDKIQIYDNQGRVIKEFMDFDNTLNISDIPKGIYYLKLETNKGMRFKKVIKK